MSSFYVFDKNVVLSRRISMNCMYVLYPAAVIVTGFVTQMIYRVSIKSFHDYKHLLQENYVEYKHIFLPLLKLVFKILCHVFIVVLQLSLYSTYSSFLVINVCNQGKTLCSPCT